jgi:hypothetical protein
VTLVGAVGLAVMLAILLSQVFRELQKASAVGTCEAFGEPPLVHRALGAGRWALGGAARQAWAAGLGQEGALAALLLKGAAAGRRAAAGPHRPHLRAPPPAPPAPPPAPARAGEPGKCSYRSYICCGGIFNFILWWAMLLSAAIVMAMGLLFVNTYIVSRLARQAAVVADGLVVSSTNSLQLINTQVRAGRARAALLSHSQQASHSSQRLHTTLPAQKPDQPACLPAFPRADQVHQRQPGPGAAQRDPGRLVHQRHRLRQRPVQ